MQPRCLEAYQDKRRKEVWLRATLQGLWTSGLQESFKTLAKEKAWDIHCTASTPRKLEIICARQLCCSTHPLETHCPTPGKQARIPTFGICGVHPIRAWSDAPAHVQWPLCSALLMENTPWVSQCSLCILAWIILQATEVPLMVSLSFAEEQSVTMGCCVAARGLLMAALCPETWVLVLSKQKAMQVGGRWLRWKYTDVLQNKHYMRLGFLWDFKKACLEGLNCYLQVLT